MIIFQTLIYCIVKKAELPEDKLSSGSSAPLALPYLQKAL
jgi:hypothetical protein